MVPLGVHLDTQVALKKCPAFIITIGLYRLCPNKTEEVR
jgi:hypothetical protein